MKEGVCQRDGPGRISYLIDRLHQQLLIGVGILFEMNFQLTVRQFCRLITGSIHLHGGNSRLGIAGFHPKIFALDAGFQHGRGMVKAVDFHLFAMLLPIGVCHDNLHRAIVFQFNPHMAGRKFAVNQNYTVQEDFYVFPACAVQIGNGQLHDGPVPIPAFGRNHGNFIGGFRQRSRFHGRNDGRFGSWLPGRFRRRCFGRWHFSYRRFRSGRLRFSFILRIAQKCRVFQNDHTIVVFGRDRFRLRHHCHGKYSANQD